MLEIFRVREEKTTTFVSEDTYPKLPRPMTVLARGIVASWLVVWPLIVLMFRESVESVWKRPVPATSNVVAGAAVPMPTLLR